MAAKNDDYWSRRIQLIYDKYQREIEIDSLYTNVYERMYDQVLELYNAYAERELTRTELYRSAKFLSFRRDLSRKLNNVSMKTNRMLEAALIKAYKDAGLAAKEELGKKSVWNLQNRKMAEACVQRKWAGEHFSERIWKNRNELARIVEKGITDAVLTGTSRGALVKELTQERYLKDFKDNIQMGRRRANTLVRTEVMHTLNAAQIETYRAEGVNYLEFDCEPTACPLCLAIAGENPHPINKIPCVIGHPNCRCTWLAVEDEDVEDARRQDGEKRKEKNVDNLTKTDIIKSGSDYVSEITMVGKINKEPLEKEFGVLKTDEIIITNERIKHIQLRHPEDYELFEKYGVKTVEEPDIIIKDAKNDNTVFMIKKLNSTNLNVVAKLILDAENNNLKNSVMTFYRIRERNLKKLQNKNKVLYKAE